MKNKVLGIILCALAALSAAAEECMDIIAPSLAIPVEIEDRTSVERYAQNFCKFYGQSSKAMKGADYGLAYRVLSASMGAAGEEAVAARYCSAADSKTTKKDVYRRYMRTLSPKGYFAYRQCRTMAEDNVAITLDPASLLPSEFSVDVIFTPSDSDETARMRHDPSKDIDCRWIQSNEPVITLNAESSTALLHCERIVYSKAGYVKIARVNGQQVVTIPWQAYDQNGLPVDLLGALKEHYEAMVSELSTFRGSVVAFDAQECPSG
uniref:Uncharacterized protein n=1 Tax=Candidatus Kentrum sp. FM TaxID=2126340 RepID=A0A450T677_9GAMM|nr:MAG: hypothetical protein BECKFM1743C_GA0114222_102816 [Candidatus Kentron sp. FM]VFJ61911.1 MAG: hypothetical protein BECKFM1743A_GA0114220_102954 [Candidatus Kentron sp. FM]VFK12831.1 MAG: hypothetical protein BECKFM1743B_GA0114221_102574 [Candidatus Kentron sp. FM]